MQFRDPDLTRPGNPNCYCTVSGWDAGLHCPNSFRAKWEDTKTHSWILIFTLSNTNPFKYSWNVLIMQDVCFSNSRASELPVSPDNLMFTPLQQMLNDLEFKAESGSLSSTKLTGSIFGLIKLWTKKKTSRATVIRSSAGLFMMCLLRRTLLGLMARTVNCAAFDWECFYFSDSSCVPLHLLSSVYCQLSNKGAKCPQNTSYNPGCAHAAQSLSSSMFNNRLFFWEAAWLLHSLVVAGCAKLPWVHSLEYG